jgi:hypothetical protein
VGHERMTSRGRRASIRSSRGPRATRRRRPIGLPFYPDAKVVRTVVAVVALLLGVYCLLAAATALYAQTDSGHPNPAELAARERYQWPGWIPIAFLGLIVFYAVTIAARRRRRRRSLASPPSTQAPPLSPEDGRRPRDAASR